MAEMKINEKERKCLKSLTEVPEEGWCKFFSAISEDTGLTKKEVRRAVRSLAKKGLTQYIRGLLDEDGSPGYFGSGYGATWAGVVFLGEAPHTDSERSKGSPVHLRSKNDTN